MLAAEDKWVSIPVCHEIGFFPWRKVTVSSANVWGGERGWGDKWWKVLKMTCLFLFGIDRNNLALGRQSGSRGAGGWLLLCACLWAEHG